VTTYRLTAGYVQDAHWKGSNSTSVDLQVVQLAKPTTKTPTHTPTPTAKTKKKKERLQRHRPQQRNRQQRNRQLQLQNLTSFFGVEKCQVGFVISLLVRFLCEINCT